MNKISSQIFPGLSIGLATFLLVAIMIWSIIWKGIALWKSARNNSIGWFVVFMILNTVGILEIIYIYLISPKQKKTA